MDGLFMAQVIAVGYNWAPRNWAQCDGQLLPISQNSALFSLIGTIYGGDGRTTFALPDLRGRVPIHAGNGPGLSYRALGSRGGIEYVTLNTTEIPSHSHDFHANNSPGNQEYPTNHRLAEAYNPALSENGERFVSGAESPNVSMNTQALGNTGASQSHNNISPFLTINWVICLSGLFPSRN